MDISDALSALLFEIATLKNDNAELTKAVAALGSMQVLIFRFLMQYDKKLAAEVAEGISRELGKSLPPDLPSAQYYKDYMEMFLNIASNPTQRDEKGRPTWIHLVDD